VYLLINPRWRRLALGLFFAAYFAYFSWSGLEAHFAPDDVMNIHVYWFPTPWRVLLSQFTVWQGVYRPMGAAFYLPLLYCFGWNPVPYHIAQSTIILAAVFLVYHFARTLDCSESVAAVAAIIVSYHAGLSNLYFNTSFVYDVLCGFFCLATFVYYLRVSEWKPRNLAVFLLLFLCALNSKEMAATLPPLLLIYEWLYHHRLNRPPIAPIAAATLLTLAFAYGRLFAPPFDDHARLLFCATGLVSPQHKLNGILFRFSDDGLNASASGYQLNSISVAAFDFGEPITMRFS